ncbi:putative Cell division protein FtsL [Oenococcus oeni]|uniref:cell division protein FtsL n=1 Tax=Oenococcus oeni TaxID=1247 RepID=UPI00107C392C|nr:cell division protein FtsL [Oenococcus oeni]AVI94334.1 cell division protein FtsL [Oenococcus oeni]SYV98175.1 putative Cell division protein FtsL [Oenococcus oeni]SYW00007.1 putative Cell division protein FtsL [Oenococcus oeni]SYW17381.1 putative Cell division protein FtsL [Oenococcus oeni]VDC14891.1 putative Cell division protein FtsL [Oenococcus oeni]
MAQNAPSITYRKLKDDRPSLTVVPSKTKRQTFKKARWSLNDYIFVFIISALVGAVMFASLLLSNATTSVNNQLETASSQITKLKSENDKSKQKITQMTSLSALKSFAKKNGMTMNSENVQNIDK